MNSKIKLVESQDYYLHYYSNKPVPSSGGLYYYWVTIEHGVKRLYPIDYIDFVACTQVPATVWYY